MSNRHLLELSDPDQKRFKIGSLVSKEELSQHTPKGGWLSHTWYLVKVAVSILRGNNEA